MTPELQTEIDDLIAEFDLLDDWEQRYRYVIDLGKDLPALDDTRKSDATKVEGCASQVWLVPDLRQEDGQARLYFEGDSDAMIVRGLIAVLHALLSGRTPQEIVDTDALAQMARLGLDQHLSAQRSNGLRAMIVRVGELARAAA